MPARARCPVIGPARRTEVAADIAPLTTVAVTAAGIPPPATGLARLTEAEADITLHPEAADTTAVVASIVVAEAVSTVVGAAERARAHRILRSRAASGCHISGSRTGVIATQEM